jgi:hypothetical protein
MRQMVGRIRVALGCDLAFPPKPTADSCFETICSEYQASLKSQESKPPEEKGWLELLVTIRRSMHHLFKAERGYETSLYHIIGSHVLPVDRYAVIGIGEEMAHTFFDSRFRPFARTEEAAFTMIDAIRRVKRSVQGCGGNTSIVAIINDDSYPGEDLGIEEVRQVEADLAFLDEATHRLFIDFPSSTTPEIFEYNFEVLRKKLHERRAEPGRLEIPFLS